MSIPIPKNHKLEYRIIRKKVRNYWNGHPEIAYLAQRRHTGFRGLFPGWITLSNPDRTACDGFVELWQAKMRVLTSLDWFIREAEFRDSKTELIWNGSFAIASGVAEELRKEVKEAAAKAKADADAKKEKVA